MRKDAVFTGEPIISLNFGGKVGTFVMKNYGTPEGDANFDLGEFYDAESSCDGASLTIRGRGDADKPAIFGEIFDVAVNRQTAYTYTFKVRTNDGANGEKNTLGILFAALDTVVFVEQTNAYGIYGNFTTCGSERTALCLDHHKLESYCHTLAQAERDEEGFVQMAVELCGLYATVYCLCGDKWRVCSECTLTSDAKLALLFFACRKETDVTLGDIKIYRGTDLIDKRDVVRDLYPWRLDGVPEYEGGVIAKEMRTESAANVLAPEKTEMMTVADTSLSEFDAYLSKLGATYRVERQESYGPVAAAYAIGNGEILYAYYTPYCRVARVIRLPSDASLPHEFGYSVPAGKEPSVIYQMQLSEPEKRSEGMFYFIKLADNSVFVIDGGGWRQIPDERLAWLNVFLHEITSTPAEDKVRISCWLITHGHADHMCAFRDFMYSYRDMIDVERMTYNIHETEDREFNRLVASVKEIYPSVAYHTLQVGETIRIADLEMNVLTTRTDAVDEYNGSEYKIDVMWGKSRYDYNDTCSVIRLTLNGGTFAVLGDVAGAQALGLAFTYGDLLRADVMQVAHHGYNYLPYVYRYIKPRISLFSNSEKGILAWGGRRGKDVLDNVNAVTSDRVVFDDHLTGVAFIDGQPTVVLSETL